MAKPEKKSKGNNERLEEHGFLQLFGEAVYFYRLAMEDGTTEIGRRALTKSSILHCVFALESAGNSLLFAADFSPALLAENDRFPILHKFELFYLRHTNNHKYNRGRAEIEAIGEMIKFWDRQVHKKVVKIPIKSRDFVDVVLEESSVPFSSKLRLPFDSKKIAPENAKSCLVAVDKFLAQFFMEDCGLKALEVDNYLSNKVFLESQSLTLAPDIFLEVVDNDMKSIGLKLKYLLWPTLEDRRSAKESAEYRKPPK